MEIMEGCISAMFIGKATPVTPLTFPQSHIIYAGSIHQAHEIKKCGYFVGSEEVQLFKVSAAPHFSFKIATVKLTPAFSKLASKSNGGCKRGSPRVRRKKPSSRRQCRGGDKEEINVKEVTAEKNKE